MSNEKSIYTIRNTDIPVEIIDFRCKTKENPDAPDRVEIKTPDGCYHWVSLGQIFDRMNGQTVFWAQPDSRAWKTLME
jgi:hypothetical protein